MTGTNLQSVSVSDDMISGACGGALSRVLSAPLDVLKIRFQLQFTGNVKYTSMYQAITTVVREEGFLSLWKGNLSATYLWITYSMCQFAFYGVLKRWGEEINAARQFESKQQQLYVNTSMLFCAGAGAGIVSAAITYPFDIMRTQFAVQGSKKAYNSMYAFVTQTWRAKGVRGFYAGLTPAVVGIAPYTGLNFAIYESMKRLTSLSDNDGDTNNDKMNHSSSTKKKESTVRSLIRQGFCGGVSGGISKFLVYPLVSY